MPIYEYECSICGVHFEKFQRISDVPADICPNGHAGVRRIYSPAGIIFKGSGFYVTDHPRGNGRPGTNQSDKQAASDKKTIKSKENQESASQPQPKPATAGAKS